MNAKSAHIMAFSSNSSYRCRGVVPLSARWLHARTDDFMNAQIAPLQQLVQDKVRRCRMTRILVATFSQTVQLNIYIY